MRRSLRTVSVLLLGLTPLASASAQVVQGIGVLPGHVASRSECIGADGTRCAGSGGLGFFRLVPITFYAPDGSDSHDLDFNAMPAAPGPGRILPGSTWYFQDWHRDSLGAGGSGYDLSSGLQVTFLP